MKRVFEALDAEAVSSKNQNLAFRRWRRPAVRPGGTLLTAVGELHIGSVRRVAQRQISTQDAHRAGYPSRQALLVELVRRPEGGIYRIELGPLLPDPRIALRESALTDIETFRDLQSRLDRLDARAPSGPWTRSVLEVLLAHPGVRAGDLCGVVGQNKVRKLKNLGITESLEAGYRLSRRGQALLENYRTRHSKDTT